jgi:tRNA A-37 threonylcarbamoyl transferase component Bud32
MPERLAQVSIALQGRYAIERELGRGGMATVYLAEDLKLHRRVALKLLHPEVSAALGPERFRREIDIAARLTHPNILALYDAGEAAGQLLFYAMPYVEGESLRQRLAREPQLPVAEAVRIAGQVAAALAHAHGQGIVHRDIKPENILLASDQALVADFGIAKMLNSSSAEKLTETGLSLGTPAYMSPEQGAGGVVDARSDIYALGCVTYEMLAGTPPFTGSTAQAILARHAVDPVPSLRTVRSMVPEPVAAAIEQALAKVPADRFASAGEFAAALVSTSAAARRRWHARSSPRVRLLGRLACVAGVAALAAGVIRWRVTAGLGVLASATRIAVLPLLAPEADTGLTRLAHDLAVTVSASLDGVGGVVTADRMGIATATSGRRALSTMEGTALARRLGARSIVRGTLVRLGSDVRADLGLYEVETDVPVAQGITVTGSGDSLRALTDSVVWALLRQVWRRGEPPTPSLTAVTTHSLPALREFLEGERELERDRWGEAAMAYRSAIAADSTFWLAYLRYSLAQYWNMEETEPEFLDALYQHRAAFPERDRLLVEAWAVRDSLPLELKREKLVAERFPDYWPAWFILGDRLHHVGPWLGHGWREAQVALNHAVALNPRLKPAWVHLFENSFGKDTIESGRAFARLRELPPDLRGRPANDPNYWRGVRLYDAVARGGGLTPRLTALLDSAAKTYVGIQGLVRFTFLRWGFPSEQIEFNRRVLLWERDPAGAASRLRENALAWAERGNWDSALAVMHEAVRLEPRAPAEGGVSAYDEYELAVSGAWLGAIDPAKALALQAGARKAARLDEGDWKTELRGQLAWFDGVLAFARHDRAAMQRTREEGRRSGHGHWDVLDRSLAAFDRALAGDRRGAGRELAALERFCLERWGQCGGFYPWSPNMALHRIASATWLLEAGDTAAATRLLVWSETVNVGWDLSLTYVVTPLAYLMRARIAEAQSDTVVAREDYRQFLRRFDQPAASQRKLVVEAKAALARLQADRGT